MVIQFLVEAAVALRVALALARESLCLEYYRIGIYDIVTERLEGGWHVAMVLGRSVGAKVASEA
jgi:hypothetical protein